MEDTKSEYWGKGVWGKGNNMLGTLLEQTRYNLHNSSIQHKEPNQTASDTPNNNTLPNSKTPRRGNYSRPESVPTPTHHKPPSEDERDNTDSRTQIFLLGNSQIKDINEGVYV